MKSEKKSGTKLRRVAAALLTTVVAMLAATSHAEPAVVSNGADDGKGSLRAALQQGASQILIHMQDDIRIHSPLVYAGKSPLTIIGSGQTILAQEDFTLLTISKGADLTVRDLNFQGPGGYSIERQSKRGDSAGKGIFIDVRKGQRGSVYVALDTVSISGVANHGIHVSDCDLGGRCGNGGDGTGGGSRASIVVNFNKVVIRDVGMGKFDADGLRVDERDRGSIHFTARDSLFSGVGADGVELDEGQEGQVAASVVDSRFERNGNYCRSQLLQEGLVTFLAGADATRDFREEEKVTRKSLPGPMMDSIEDSCFEYDLDLYPSGYVKSYDYSLDVDDGFDVDEEGKGALQVQLINVVLADNFDEGVDLDEKDAGNVEVFLINNKVSGSGDEGITISENGRNGVQGLFYKVETSDNGDGGLKVRQRGKGKGLVLILDSKIDGGVDSEGVELVEH